MFCVGLEFRVDLVARFGRRAISVSVAGIAAAVRARRSARAGHDARAAASSPQPSAPVHAVLFLGAAMSITAFPVLARIISERGIAGTTIGSLALAAGAMDDAAAWIILAIVLSSFTGNAALALAAAGGAVAVRGDRRFSACGRCLSRLAAAAERDGGVPTATLVTVLGLLAAGAWFTDLVGIAPRSSARSCSASASRAACCRASCSGSSSR